MGQLEAATDFLFDVIKIRAASQAIGILYVIACENGFDSWDLRRAVSEKVEAIDPGLRQQFEHLRFLRSVVDRICRLPQLAPITESIGDEEYLTVRVENYFQWIIEATGSDNPLVRRLFSALPGIAQSVNEFVRGALLPPKRAPEHFEIVADIWPFRRRKLWLMNGTHILISIHAKSHGFAGLQAFLLGEATAITILDSILHEMIAIHQTVDDTFNKEELTEFGTQIRNRLISCDDEVGRILRRLTSDKIEEFFRDFFLKIGDPVLTALLAGAQPPTWITITTFLVIRAVARKEFADVDAEQFAAMAGLPPPRGYN